ILSLHDALPISLNHPMYATCIGLILRGYSDYEHGKLNFNSNCSRSVEAQLQEQDVFMKVADMSQETTQAAIPESVAESPEQQAEKQERNTRRSETIKKVFNQIKNGFMSFFEEPDDQKI